MLFIFMQQASRSSNYMFYLDADICEREAGKKMKVSKVKIKLLRCVTVETNKWSSMRTAESRAVKGKIHFMLHRLPGKFIHIVSNVCNIFASSKKLYKKGKKKSSLESLPINQKPQHCR